MTEQEFKLSILYETLNVTCRYYQDDEEICLKFGFLDNDASFPTCNCDGKISECDLYRWASIEKLI